MRQNLKIYRIIKIEKCEALLIRCMFSNGESRLLDFKKIFREWQISEKDIEFKLLNLEEFHKVKLRNHTLSWPNIEIIIQNDKGLSEKHPYEIGPDVLYSLSDEVRDSGIGNMIKSARLKAGLTQEQLASKIGTSRFYISRVENNRTDIELSTIRKIIEAGLDKQLKLTIE